jgi:hypothetical protein
MKAINTKTAAELTVAQVLASTENLEISAPHEFAVKLIKQSRNRSIFFSGSMFLPLTDDTERGVRRVFNVRCSAAAALRALEDVFMRKVNGGDIKDHCIVNLFVTTACMFIG